MVHVENINKVADAIEQGSFPDLGFNMATYFGTVRFASDNSNRGCGTVACIAGWTYIVQNERIPKHGDIDPFVLATFLGLNESQYSELFYPGGANNSHKWEEISQEQALRTLRHLAETGEVNWEI